MSRGWTGQGLRYAVVGGLVFAVDLAVFLAVLGVAPAAPVAANSLAKVAGAASGFALHRRYTFSWHQRDGWRRQLLLYAAVLAFNTGLSSLLLLAAVAGWGTPPAIAKLMAEVVTIACAFALSRHLVFRAARP